MVHWLIEQLVKAEMEWSTEGRPSTHAVKADDGVYFKWCEDIYINGKALTHIIVAAYIEKN